jgi:RNA polymerase sigma-70 factor (ECF subfamily)
VEPWLWDKKLVQEKKFIEGFLACQDDIKAFVRSLVRDHAAADELFQDIALTMWEKFDTYDSDRPFGAWVRGIALNKVLQYRGKSRRTPIPFSPEAIEAVLDAYEVRQQRAHPALDALERCLKPLPQKSLEMLSMRYGQSWTVREIAEAIGSNIAAVHKALARLRSRLLDCVQRRLAAREEVAR